MSKFDETDVFTDASLVEDPFPYFEYLRSQCPVHPLPRRNVMVVTGYNEAITVYTNTKAFSSAIGVGGPIPPLPFRPEGDDISAQLEQFRDQMPYTTQIVTMDDERHAATRSLLMRLFTPSRLRENEAYIRRVADERIDSFINKGSCEFFSEYGHPFAMLVIADLLGVSDKDREMFRRSWKTRRRLLQSMNTRLPTSSCCSWASFLPIHGTASERSSRGHLIGTRCRQTSRWVEPVDDERRQCRRFLVRCRARYDREATGNRASHPC